MILNNPFSLPVNDNFNKQVSAVSEWKWQMFCPVLTLPSRPGLLDAARGRGSDPEPPRPGRGRAAPRAAAAAARAAEGHDGVAERVRRGGVRHPGGAGGGGALQLPAPHPRVQQPQHPGQAAPLPHTAESRWSFQRHLIVNL